MQLSGDIRLQLAQTMLWTDERLQQVIAQYTPVLHLHEEERYLPCSVDWYIKRSQLWLEEPVAHVSSFWAKFGYFCGACLRDATACS